MTPLSIVPDGPKADLVSLGPDFLEYHPGGAGVILNKAGQDAT